MMRVYISYSSGSSIAYCFWKYFFQSCGVWVTSQKIGKNWVIDKTKKPQLVILDNKTKEKYGTSGRNIVYCFDEMNFLAGVRKDFFGITQWKSIHNSVLGQLLAGNENLDVLTKLLRIFSAKYDMVSGKMEEEGLWSAIWLFHEIAQPAGNKEWDDEIRKKARQAISVLQSGKYALKGSWYHQYMTLYCRYLQCGVNRSSISRMEQCKNLMEQCAELSEKTEYEGNFALSFLMGKISFLTAAGYKEGVKYFTRMAEFEPQPDIYYEIGQIYEKAYGDHRRAMEFYKEAYCMDHNYYRSLYKLAVKLERSGDWERAVTIYIKIEDIIKKTKPKDSISIRDFEYEYKSRRKLLWLINEYMNEPELVDGLQSQIDDMKNNMDSYVRFDKLFQKMFLENNQQGKIMEMKGELEAKLNQDCYKIL